MTDQSINSAGLAIIKKYEGCRLTVYADPAGLLTVGWGHRTTLPLGTAITQKQADNWLIGDIQGVENFLNNPDNIKYELTDNEFSSLVSFVFNVGTGDFEHHAIYGLINSGDMQDVPQHMVLYIHDAAGKIDEGLVKRRADEAALWTMPDAV